jgi:hypothetical protein
VKRQWAGKGNREWGIGKTALFRVEKRSPLFRTHFRSLYQDNIAMQPINLKEKLAQLKI